MKYYFVFLIVLILACNKKHENTTNAKVETGQPLTASKKFNGNTLTVTATGEPPLIVTLYRKGESVWHDFLDRPGSVNIDIASFRKDHGAYSIQVEDGADRDTTIDITIDRYAPRSKRNGTGKRQSKGKGKYLSGKFVVIRDRTVNYIQESIISCKDCNARDTLYYSKYKVPFWTAKSDITKHYRYYVPACKEACRRKCGGK